MPWIWGTLTLADDKETSDPYHLVWPRDFYHAATAQKAAGDDAARGPARRLPVAGPEGASGSFWQNTRVDGTPVWKSQQLDETALPVVLAWWLGRTARRGLGQHPRRGRLPDGQRAALGPGALGEPGRLLAEHDRDGDRRARVRGRRRAQQRRPRPRGRLRGRRRRLAGEGRELDGDRPTAPTPPGPTTCGSPRTRKPEQRRPCTRSATTSRARSTSARSSTTRSSGSCCSASSAGTTARSSTRCRSATRRARSRCW